MKKKRRHKKPLKRGLRRPFEWLGILLGLLLFSNVTHRMMLALCDFASAVMYRFDRAGRAAALFNLRVVTGVYAPDRDAKAPIRKFLSAFHASR